MLECAISPDNCQNCSGVSIPCGTSIRKLCDNGTTLLDVCPVNTQSYEDAACSLGKILKYVLMHLLLMC